MSLPEIDISSWDALVRQSPKTTDKFMWAAVEWVDKHLGDDACKQPKNFPLIIAHLNASVEDFRSTCIVVGLQRIAERLREDGEE